MEIFTPPNVKAKRPPGRQSKHSETFRLMVAKKVIEEGMKYREAAKNFGLSHGSITNIIKNYHQGKLRGKRREYISKHNQEVENYRTQQHVNDLKLQIADLFLENLMLKKMLDYSRRMKKENSSDITSENLDLLPEHAK
jgi:transposase